ncbi:Dr1-associated corepressor [Geodia barretti]|uniref:Dr1-associated corepressor n=1 Tax=Geodia barretti TaxID=519541 RepID=A0AA35XDH9_GEOBA|nr:Dr1-associated corepressor [Geodia barretti]
MPPKRRKFESTFPAARIKKIMQLDDDVGRVASSVPVVISRAVEIFLQALLTRGADYAATRNAKTLTVGHLKHCIEQEKQWDFLRELTAKISDVTAQEDSEEATGPKRGRKRKGSPLPGSSSASGAGRGRRKQKATTAKAAVTDADEASGSSEEGTSAAHVASRGMFSDYFNKASSSSRSSSVASASPSVGQNSRQQAQASTSSTPHPPTAAPLSLLSLPSSSHLPSLTPSSDSATPANVDLPAMTAGLHRHLPGARPANEEEEEEDYDDE